MSAAVAESCVTACHFHDEVHRRRDQSLECVIAENNSGRPLHENSSPLHQHSRLADQPETARTVR
jgi:hypothetical protein